MVRQILASTSCVVLTITVLADASGKWTFTSQLLPPDLTCELDVKDEKLLGTCSAVNITLPVSDGQIIGNTLRWTINVPADSGITTVYDFVGELDERAASLKGSLTFANAARTQTEKAVFVAVRR